jgi:CHAD domain-containing protein
MGPDREETVLRREERRPPAEADRPTTVDGRDSPEVHRGGGPAEERGRRERAGKEGQPAAGAVVLAAVAAQVQALQSAELEVRTGDPDGVHDLRVACRRLRSIFAAFRPVLGGARTDPLRGQLKWLGAQLSGARDSQVALGHLRRLVDAQTRDLVLGPVAARLQQMQVAESTTGRQGAHRALGDDRYRQLLDDLSGLLADPPVTALAAAPAAEVLTAAIRRSDERLRSAVERSRREGSGDHLHEVRKAAKRLRYTAEVAVAVLGERAQALVDSTTLVQQVLGDRQDTAVTREQCRDLGLVAFAAGENAWSYGRLHALEEARGQRAEADFWALLPRLDETARRAVTSRRAT